MMALLAKLIRRLAYEILRVTAGTSAAAQYLGVRVGRDCRIITRDLGSEPWMIRVGDRVTIANNVSILTHDGSTGLIRDSKGRRFRYARVEIGDDVFIGVQCVILPGVRIGTRVIVAAGSIVTSSVPDGVIVAGNPARVIGKFSDYERRILQTCHASEDMVGANYRERVLSIAENGFRSELTQVVDRARK